MYICSRVQVRAISALFEHLTQTDPGTVLKSHTMTRNNSHLAVSYVLGVPEIDPQK